jgi:4-aminobutyrate aminotransferase
MLTSQNIIDKKKEIFFPNAMHFYQKPPHIVKGAGQYLFDDQGERYTDFFAGVTVVNCGHCNQEINEGVQAQLNTLQHTSIIYLTEPMVKLAEALADVLPGDINRTFFVNSGTEANEGALLLARLHTGKRGFIAFEGGLHGRSALTMSVTGIPMWRIDPYLDENVHFVKGYMASQAGREAQARASLEHLKEILEAHGEDIAALIAEPLLGNGGIHVPPICFWQEVKALCEAHGVLMIADEVQTGFGRCGEMFAVNHFGVVPDIITYAKALGNGTPIGGFSAREAVAKSFNKPSASTLGGNPVSMTAGLEVLSYIERHKLVEKSAELGAYLISELKKLTFSCIKDVRGLGLMVGMSLARPEQVDAVLEAMKDKGFIIGKNGLNRDTLAFQPPLIITKEDIDAMLTSLKGVLEAL